MYQVQHAAHRDCATGSGDGSAHTRSRLQWRPRLAQLDHARARALLVYGKKRQAHPQRDRSCRRSSIEARKYPLIVNPARRPEHACRSDAFSTRWNYHLLTSPGYVLHCNELHGLDGFWRETFADDIERDVLRGAGAGDPGSGSRKRSAATRTSTGRGRRRPAPATAGT